MQENKSSDTITLEINGKRHRFPGKEGALIRKLLKAHDSCRNGDWSNETLSKKELEFAVWGEEIPKGGSNLSNLINKVNSRVPRLITSSGGVNSLSKKKEEFRWSLFRGYTFKEARSPLPEPKKGKAVECENDPMLATIAVQVQGFGHQHFKGREAALMRLMMKNKMAFRNSNEIQLALGCSPSKRGETVRTISKIRDRLDKDIFQIGTYGKGWRLDPQRKMFVVYDIEKLQNSHT